MIRATCDRCGYWVEEDETWNEAEEYAFDAGFRLNDGEYLCGSCVERQEEADAAEEEEERAIQGVRL